MGADPITGLWEVDAEADTPTNDEDEDDYDLPDLVDEDDRCCRTAGAGGALVPEETPAGQKSGEAERVLKDCSAVVIASAILPSRGIDMTEAFVSRSYKPSDVEEHPGNFIRSQSINEAEGSAGGALTTLTVTQGDNERKTDTVICTPMAVMMAAST